MTEANYSFTTKVNGDLFTVRGNSHGEFQTNLAEACDGLNVTLELMKHLQGVGNAAVLAAPQPAAPAAQVPTPPPAPPQGVAQQNPWPQQQPQQQQPFPSSAQPVQAQAAGHVCACGLPMKLRNGQYGSFYSCSKQMNDPSRCQTKINV